MQTPIREVLVGAIFHAKRRLLDSRSWCERRHRDRNKCRPIEVRDDQCVLFLRRARKENAMQGRSFKSFFQCAPNPVTFCMKLTLHAYLGVVNPRFNLLW